MPTALEPSREEILRYLGFQEQAPDKNTKALIEEMIRTVQNTAAVGACFGKSPCRILENGVYLEKYSLLLPGEDIKKHLSGCLEVVLMALTLGIGIERKIREYEISDMTKAVILDCTASAMVETACNQACKEFDTGGLHQTERFSPGYGDLPISLQADFLRILNAGRRIGLTANDSSLLLPRKSVTAVIGLSETLPKKPDRCASCRMRERCEYRKRGDSCEN